MIIIATIEDQINKINNFIQSVPNNSFAQSLLKQEMQDKFHKQLSAYNKKRHNLSQKELDSLIWAIASGKNTYKDLQAVVPALNSPTMSYYLLDDPQAGPNQFTVFSAESHSTYFQFQELPDDFFYLYEFKPEDKFILNIPGENRLYELQKEREALLLAQKSVSSADAAVSWAKISVFVSIILFILGIIINH